MKPTRTETIKATLKTYKGDVTKITKANIIKQYTADVTWLMRELAKAQKPSV